MEEASRWSSLPKDLLTSVSRKLNTGIDILRLRAVCTSWRSLVPLPRKNISFPLPVPSPPSPSFFDFSSDPGLFNIVESTLYRISPVYDGDSSHGSSDSWLVMAVERNPNTLSLLNPLTTEAITSFSDTFPGQINLLNYRVSELGKAHSLRFFDCEHSDDHLRRIYRRKAVVLANYVLDHDFVVLILHYRGKLMVWKFGDNNWGSIECDGCIFEDIILCKGKCYAIDSRGFLFMIDSALKPVKIASTGHLRGYAKHLVEYKGEIYSVATVHYPEPELCYDYFEDDYVIDETTIDLPLLLRVFQFNEKHRDWDFVGNLGRKAFFLGDDVTFSISIDEFGGCKENGIYLRDEAFAEEEEPSAYGVDTGVFNLDDHSTVALASAPEFAEVFWPPPSWLTLSTTES